MDIPHAVCVPLPAQGHINPMLKLAKLLHSQGFYITFVQTEFNHQRLVDTRGPESVAGLPDFHFETISDGLPPDNRRGILELPALCLSLPIHGLRSFRDLIVRLGNLQDVPPVSCIVSDGVMGFTMEVAQEFCIPEVLFFTVSGCGMLGYLQFDELLRRGLFPLKDESCLRNGYLDFEMDWIPGIEGIRLKDLPSFIRTTNHDDIMFNYNLESINNALRAKSIILNTFEDLEQEALDVMRMKFDKVYTIGPLIPHKHFSHSKNSNSVDLSLWKEDDGCLDWLDKKKPGSVLYVNFGSLVIVTKEQLSEFAWGLANSRYQFLWVIRPNLIENGREIIISNEFQDEVRGRGLLLDWCPQEKVLAHPAIGGFLTHCGWNSVLESISHGVPMICWPFFAEQQMNCLYLCEKWGMGMEIESDVKREKVEGLVRELMEGEKGKKIRGKAMGWMRKAEEAGKPGGSSYVYFDMLLKHLNIES